MRALTALALCACAAFPPNDVLADGVAGAPQPGSAELQARLDRAYEGDVVDLGGATWSGPATIDKRVVLRAGTIDGRGQARVLVIKATDVVLDHVTVRHSGKDLSAPDACVWIDKSATRTQVRDSTFIDCGFGIWVDETDGTRIVRNRIVGSLTGPRSDRGNGIQLFNASHASVLNNVVTGGRDGIYVSATEDSVIEGNDISTTRIGVHYMFSYDNTVRNNVARANQTGFALMGSRRIIATANIAEHNETHGLLFRDVEQCVIDSNRSAQNGEGLFFFSSTGNRITRNQVIDNDIGAKIWAGSIRNVLSGNVFGANRQQVFYVGHDDLVLGGDGPGNFWSDYLGWDQNGDGIGDRPYRVDSFSAGLMHRFPAATLLLRSPALELLTHLEQSLPILRVATVVDRSPLLRSVP